MSQNKIIQGAFKAAFAMAIASGKKNAGRKIAEACIPPEFKPYAALSQAFVDACLDTKTLYFRGSEFLNAIASNKVDPAAFPVNAMAEFFQMYSTLPSREQGV
jgi:hypothetical protein